MINIYLIVNILNTSRSFSNTINPYMLTTDITHEDKQKPSRENKSSNRYIL